MQGALPASPPPAESCGRLMHMNIAALSAGAHSQAEHQTAQKPCTTPEASKVRSGSWHSLCLLGSLHSCACIGRGQLLQRGGRTEDILHSIQSLQTTSPREFHPWMACTQKANEARGNLSAGRPSQGSYRRARACDAAASRALD